ncbi:peroxidase 51-like protein [Carex littledalei]|uniref:Peroxidase n=1 Tax=Carex littledalei TaxID=544730 RepID=A0A833VII3_9POAL|nr:peroxidase 51-like protein [Carex littledalei]
MRGLQGIFLLFPITLCLFSQLAYSQLTQNYYSNTCPNVESIVRAAVTKKFSETPITVGATIRLFFHDCFVQGCDASVIVASSGNNTAEKDHPINLSLAGDGFDTVIRAKAAVDAVPQCTNRVSCADILTMATRDVIALSGGPSYTVELGRLDGLRSSASDVNRRLPGPDSSLDQLTNLFAVNGLSMSDMIALSGAHTIGFAHCTTFSNRIRSTVDSTMNPTYARQLQAACPANANPNLAVGLDPVTPRAFDNQYFKNLQQGMGLLRSDQVLFTDSRSRPLVNSWAQSTAAFQRAFVNAITKLGRVGVKTGANGNIRRNCAVIN